LLAMLTVVLLLSAWIWWLAARSPAISFLSRAGAAEWIVYPLVPDPLTRPSIKLDTVFRRNWWLETAPANAILEVRAFRECQIRLNNTLLETAPRADENWKKPTTYDVARFLRSGTNEISVVVANSDGPPAVWLSLRAGRRRILNSDASWQASFCGAVWQPARPASAPMLIRKGNRLAGGERCLESFVGRLPTLLLFAGLSMGVLWLGRYRWRRSIASGLAGDTGLSRRHRAILIALAGGLWIVLFLHNVRCLPAANGFDVDGHLQYIDYIRQRHALPLPDEGLEMLQPPLYYLIGAFLLGVLHLPTYSDNGVVALRLFGLVLGLAELGLVLAGLRLIFPNNARKQTAGLILAAFTPLALYMYQYVSNEILAATLGTASIYCCLRILNSERPSVGLYGALGLCLGAALLSKITLVVVAAVVLATLGGRLLVQREHDFRVWLRALGLPCILCVAVSGWHYYRVWAHFGGIAALMGGPRVTVGPSGGLSWQDPGYGTAAYYARFGQSLVAPLFSGLNGFVDGLYSTLWGDGWCGGVASLNVRPPWNYDLMAAGYWFAVLPTVAMLVGLMAAVIRLVGRRQAPWFLLTGLLVPMALGLVYFPLSHPYYFGNTKAQYGLPVMMSLYAFGAWGIDILSRRWRISRVILWAGLGTWAINSYSSMWIQPQAPYTRVALSRMLELRGNLDAAAEGFQKVLAVHPQNAGARLALAETLEQMGRTEEAALQYESAWRDHPHNPDCAAAMVGVLARDGRFSEAITLAQQVVQDEPDRPDLFPLLGRLFTRLQQFDKAVAAYEEALRITPDDPNVHCDVGVLDLRLGRYGPAAEHFAVAVRLRPDDAEAHFNLGVALEGIGKPAEAIGQYEQALQIKPDYPEARHNLAALQSAQRPNTARHEESRGSP